MQMTELQKCTKFEQEIVVLLERILKELRIVNQTEDKHNG